MIGNPFRAPGIVIVEVNKNKKCRYNKVKENDNNSIECGNLMAKMAMYTDLKLPLLEPIYDSD
jgi:hypothetical protein